MLARGNRLLQRTTLPFATFSHADCQKTHPRGGQRTGLHAHGPPDPGKAAFEVREVNAPTAALRMARLFRPDLVLLDVEMPGMDGGEVARGFQAEEAFRQVPIIFMTSLVTEEETAKNPMTTNGLRVLAKPVTMAKLVQCVVERLGGLVADSGAVGAR